MYHSTLYYRPQLLVLFPSANLFSSFSSARQMDFMQSKPCHSACTKKYTAHDKEAEKRVDTIKKGISLNYQHHWIVGK